MEKSTGKAVLMSFALFAALFGLFYLFADFGKALSRQCGLFQLAAATVLLAVLLMKKDGIHVLCRYIVPAIALGQIVALYNWIVWNGVTATLFGWRLSLGWLGFSLHAVFAVWGGILAGKLLRNQRA